MNNLQDVFDIMTGFAEAYFLYMLCEAFMSRRDCFDGYKYFYPLVITIGLGLIIDITNSLFSFTVLNMIMMIIELFAVSFLYIGKIKDYILAAILTVMINMTVEVCVLQLLTVLFDSSAENMIAPGGFRIMGIVMSKFFCYIVVKYICYKFKTEKIGLDAQYWILFSVLFFITALTMLTFCKVLESNSDIYIRNLCIACSCGLVFSTVVILKLYEYSSIQQHSIYQEKLLTLRFKEQIRHYDNIMMSQNQIRRIKHDLKNHLLSIKGILEKRKIDESLDYVNNLLGNVDSSNVYMDTGNTVLDAMLGEKKAQAEKYGIEFISDIMIPGNIPISNEDQCVIFGNALDNAIEAARTCGNKKYIDLSLVFKKDTLIFKLANSCGEVVETGTGKKDGKNHGIGKKSISTALKKYNAVSRVRFGDGEYVLTIIFMGLKF